jgi:glyoxylase-like metal-dependent hydrolase (beta-lactamase superfamily II)
MSQQARRLLFLIQEVMPNIFQIQIPLPGDPLGTVNAYLIRGDGRNLLIDTGYNRPESKASLLADLERLGLDSSNLELLITHMHGDHAGLGYELARNNSRLRVYSSEIDAGVLRAVLTAAYWQAQGSAFIANGFPPADMERQADHIKSLFSGSEMHFQYVTEGDVLEVGAYRFTCVMTPGHTHGHLCLYEADRRCLISGDHILPGISPTITAWRETGNPLGEYFQSLEKVKKMAVDLVLPGHRGVFHDCQGRIAELELHHRARLDEVLEIIQKGAMSAYRVAGLMSWNTKGNSWDQLPAFHRYFATGEALAHLKYLVQEKKILMMRNEEEKIIFQAL